MPDTQPDDVTFETATAVGVPKLTTLYRLRIRGIGTGHPESLRSYAHRLALKHRVTFTHLCVYVLSPLLHALFNWRLPDRNGGRDGHVLGGVGNATSRIVRAIECATGERHLRGLTLVPLGKAFAANGLSPSGPRHCPDCLTPSLDENYGRLLWEVGFVRACPVHGVRLLDASCGDPRPRSKALRTALVGVCSNCGSVGYRCQSRPDAATSQEIWEADQVEGLLAAIARDGIVIDSVRLRQGIRIAAEIAGNGVVTRGAAKAGIAKSVISHWLSGRNLPSLEKVLRLCLVAKVTLVSVALGEPKLVAAPAPAPDTAISPRRRSRKPSAEFRRNALSLARAQRPPPSLQSIANALGIDRKMLSVGFPQLSAEIVAIRRQLEFRVNLAHRRSATSLIRSVLADLERKGLPYTVRNVRAACGDTMLPNDILRRTYKELVGEIHPVA